MCRLGHQPIQSFNSVGHHLIQSFNSVGHQPTRIQSFNSVGHQPIQSFNSVGHQLIQSFQPFIDDTFVDSQFHLRLSSQLGTSCFNISTWLGIATELGRFRSNVIHWGWLRELSPVLGRFRSYVIHSGWLRELSPVLGRFRSDVIHSGWLRELSPVLGRFRSYVRHSGWLRELSPVLGAATRGSGVRRCCGAAEPQRANAPRRCARGSAIRRGGQGGATTRSSGVRRRGGAAEPRRANAPRSGTKMTCSKRRAGTAAHAPSSLGTQEPTLSRRQTSCRAQAQRIRWARPGAAWKWASPAQLRVNLAASASACCNA
jgi:hypothetical protein